MIHPQVRWAVISDNEITATWGLDGEERPVHLVIDDRGALKKVFLERWGNPGETGQWEYIRFGVNVLGEARYKDMVIPVKGNAGWWFGEEKYDDGEFFRFEVKA